MLSDRLRAPPSAVSSSGLRGDPPPPAAIATGTYPPKPAGLAPLRISGGLSELATNRARPFQGALQLLAPSIAMVIAAAVDAGLTSALTEAATPTDVALPRRSPSRS